MLRKQGRSTVELAVPEADTSSGKRASKAEP